MSERDPAIELLWRMYQENTAQGRHHEAMRSIVLTALLAIAAWLTVSAFDERLSIEGALPLGAAIVGVGLFGLVFGLKSHERFRLHMERAQRYRRAVDAFLPGQPLSALKREADRAHGAAFPTVERLRLHWYWGLVFVGVIACGGYILAVAADLL